jgi:hypothetical protein
MIMKQRILFSAIITTLLATSSAFAAAPAAKLPGAPATGAPVSDAIDAASLAKAQQKLAHAVQIANQFASSAAAEGLNERWRGEMINALMAKPEQTFAQVAATGNVRDAMSVATAGTTATAKDLGDTADDLTYIPLPSPCRIVDTRTGGGQLVANTPRNFSFTQSNTTQGGSGCTPFTGYVGGGVPGAAALNITVIGGSAAVAGSFLQAYPGGGSTTTSWLNFGAGQVIANEGILGISSTFVFTLKTNAAADAIVDVFGSFVRNHATQLDCVAVGANAGDVNASNISIPANSNSFYEPQACPAGYNVVSVNCYANGGSNVYLTGSGISGGGAGSAGFGFCGYVNLNASAVNVRIGASCCRIPGRTN